MDKTYVKSVLEGLTSSSTTRVQDCLMKIRSKIISSDQGIRMLRECSGLEYLVPFLRKPNERTLDVTLSVLGNCCMEEESCLEVGKLNIFSPLINILKTVNRDSIVGRTCRVIGNLAQRTSNADCLLQHGAMAALIELIETRDKNTSYPTLTMAVRAIRLLWMVTEKREEMLAQGVVRVVAILLTAECEGAGIIKTLAANKQPDVIRKSQEELFSGILKCMGYFTTLASVPCAEQIQGDGRGYQCLVALTKTFETPALKGLMNLCFVSSCRPLLGTAGVVECLVGILQKHSEVEWWPEGAARALAQLSGEAVNRSRLRHCGGLPLLLAAARVSPHAMFALLQYVFDDSAFQILVNEGLINFLTDELTNYITTMEYEHIMDSMDYLDVDKPPDTSAATENNPESNLTSNTEAGANTSVSKQDGKNETLLMRRRSKLLSGGNEDELKVVIERDNMIVGFMDAVDSDVSDNSQTDDEDQGQNRKSLKRARSRSPQGLKKQTQLIRMANRDWSASIYWEPKSPEWPSNPRVSGASRPAMSPDRPDLSPWSAYSDGYQSGKSPEYKSFASQSKRPRWDCSPESGVSTGAEGSSSSPHWAEYQWSPGSSGSHCMSPCSGNDDTSDSEVSGRYSPVCSEAESETEDDDEIVARETAAELSAAQVAHDLDDLIMDDEESLADEVQLGDSSKIESNSKTVRIGCVLVLLFRVSHGAATYNGLKEDPATNNITLEMLTRNECMGALLDYVERCKRPLGRATRILARILSNALCLTTVLKNRLALRLHNMSANSRHPTAKCKQCKQVVNLSTKLLAQLSVLAESDYGIGEISYQLLKGSPAMKQTLSFTLPYIVRNGKPLKKYFKDCSALTMLVDSISEAKEKMDLCVVGLVKLATNLQIKDPKSMEQRFKEQISLTYDPILDNLSLDEIVTFELDDKSTVVANKVFLCQNSDVFNAMLMGRFKESVEERVNLKKVTKAALEYLLTLLHCGLNNAKGEVQTFPLAEKLETNLEVLMLADRFLFDKLKLLLFSAIVQFQLSPKTVDKIYIWSLNEGMGFMCVESVAYILTGKMGDAERMISFKNILNMQYKDQWLDDIKTMILRHFVK